MKKIYTLLACLSLLQLSGNLSAQVIFSQDFSTATGSTPPTGWVNNDIEGGGEVWVFDNPGGQNLSAPITDPAAIFDSDFNGSMSGPEEAALESPVFDASTVTGSILLSFDHTFFDSGESTGAVYYVEVWDGTAWVQVLSGTADTDDPTHVSLNITTAVNGANDAQVRFRWTGDWGYWWILDNIVVEEVSCAPVFDVSVTSVTTTQLTIDWTAGGSETDWNIEYGPEGFTQGTGTPGTATGTPGFTAGSLTPNTSYDFYIQADCGGGDESTWFGPLHGFTGFCEFEGLDSYVSINSFSTTGGTTSNISNLNSGFATNGYENATAMVVASFEGGPAVNFDAQLNDYFGFSIWVDWNDNMIFEGSEQVFSPGFYDESFSGSINVPTGAVVGPHRMRILTDGDNGEPNDPCSTDFGSGEAEDYTFEVTAIPSCLPVSGLTSAATTPTSAEISWTVEGTETDWNIEYGPAGFTPGTGTPGTASGTPSFTATPLTPETSYDFYVQADCGAGDESTWSGPITVYTGYCEFSTSNTNYYINNFSTTGGATTNISNLNTGIGPNGYTDATTMTVSQFEGGPDVNFTVDFGFQTWYTFGFGVWVDWNNNMAFEPAEQMFQSFGYQDNFSGSFGVPAGVAVGSYRMRILADYFNSSPTDACTTNSGEGEVEDYTFVVVPIPTCLPVTDLTVDSEGTDFLDISWTPGDSETNWNIEWGMPGFVPGTGNGIDSAQQSSSASFSVTGLNPSTVYDVYVQASCSSTDSSYWTLVSGTTLCAPITALPWTENFDAMPSVDYGVYPLCWLSENFDFLSDNGGNTPGVANSGSNFVGIYSGSNDHLWTPEFELVAGHNYEFSFMWATADENTGWNGSVVVNNTQSSTGATVLAPFIATTESPETDYKRSFFCFTPTASGVYTFGVKVIASFNPWFMSFDDFNLMERGTSAGTNGAANVCQINELVDLNDVIGMNDAFGTWSYSPNQVAIVNDTLFNPQFVIPGTVSVDYITEGCLVDTATAMITVYPPSNAGVDGTITACMNEPIDLLSGLNGTMDMGGDWYNAANTLLPNSQFNTSNTASTTNYKYIVGNGVCPDDTSNVVVTVVTTCDWMSVDENAFESVSLYPNPSTGLVYIESSLSTESFHLVVTDVNGRVVKTANNSITNGLNTVDLNEVQRGTYFFKLSTESAEKVYRVVIQ